ncbi:hypothetical protein MSPP1_000838 [Malassezia sp. CBS 17886]|nr:hypothetical protein MSPP1_000838 [Malassezia sp. CBS 17886]
MAAVSDGRVGVGAADAGAAGAADAGTGGMGAGDVGTADAALGTGNVFPPPPALYMHFTGDNLLWLDVLERELALETVPGRGVVDPWTALSREERIAKQTAVLQKAIDREGTGPDHPPLPDVDLLATLRPPRVDWIEEDGGFQLFGQRWPIPESTPSLEQLGITRLCPESGTDLRPALQTLLRTILLTYYELTGDLQRPIQEYPVWVKRAAAPGAESTDDGGDTQGDRDAAPQGVGEEDDGPRARGGSAEEELPAPGSGHWTTSSRIRDRLKHLETAVINFQYLVNQLRPLQASAALETYMEEQIARREGETRALRDRCKEVRAELALLDM